MVVIRKIDGPVQLGVETGREKTHRRDAVSLHVEHTESLCVEHVIVKPESGWQLRSVRHEAHVGIVIDA
jgi:hypothetical protein